MGVEQGLLALIGAADVGAYEIEQSLRFNNEAENVYLSKTFSSDGNRRKWTWSAWIKLGRVSDEGHVFEAYTGSGDYELFMRFNSNDSIRFGQFTNTAYDWKLDTTAKFRDPSAWYHVVLVFDSDNATSSDRARIYVNGERVTSFDSATYPASGANGYVNKSGYPHYLCNSGLTTRDFGGYLAEVNFIDGVAVTDALDFGEYDDNGVWRPIKYAGSYTGNSFYLKFDASDVDGDSSGLGNDFTATGVTTSGTGTDVMSDTPTNNFATLNAVDSSTNGVIAAFREGNLEAEHRSGSGNYSLAVSTIAFDSDDSDGFYFESIATDYVASSYQSVCLIDASKTVQEFIGNASVGASTGSTFGIGWESSSGYLRNFGSGTTGWGPTTTTWTSDGDILMVFVKNNKIYLGKNGTWLQSADPSTESNPAITLSSTYKLKPGTAGRYSAKQSFNFGQRAFSYTPPTGAKTLCTANLPAPDIADGSDYFDTVLWTGNQTARTISMNSTFTPDFIWIKNRTSGYNHSLQDNVRGYGPSTKLNSNTTTEENAANTEPQAGYVDSVAAGSFDIDASATATWYHNNVNSNAYVGWCWKAGGSVSADNNTNGSITSTVSVNPTAGFSIVSYTGTGVNATVGHGLGVAPKMIIAKDRDASVVWAVHHSDISINNYLRLNTDDNEVAGNAVWNQTAPTSTVFSIGTSTIINNTNDYIAYCFAEVEGFSRIGSFVGNQNADGPFIFCGFRPRYVWLKGSTFLSNWNIYDSARDQYNITDDLLRLNSAAAEVPDYGATAGIDLLSNGFKIRTAALDWNSSGQTFVFCAFAENPFGGSGVSPATAR